MSKHDNSSSSDKQLFPIGIEELDTLISLELDLQSLQRTLRVSKYFSKIILTPKFWYFKVEKDYGKEAKSYKPEKESYLQQFVYLYDARDHLKEAKLGRTDALVVLRDLCGIKYYEEAKGCEQNFRNWKDCFYYASINGHLDTLRWLEENDIGCNREEHDRDWILYHIVRGSHLRVLKYLAKMGWKFNVELAVELANLAARCGYLAIIEWFYEIYGILPNYDGAQDALKNRYWNVLRWLKPRGIILEDVGEY